MRLTVRKVMMRVIGVSLLGAVMAVFEQRMPRA